MRDADGGPLWDEQEGPQDLPERQGIPIEGDHGRSRHVWSWLQDRREPIGQRLERLRRDPTATGENWLLALLPAYMERVESGEWYGTTAMLAQALRETVAIGVGPSPACLASPAEALKALRRAIPTLRSWGYAIRIDPHPDGGEVVYIDGILGELP